MSAISELGFLSIASPDFDAAKTKVFTSQGFAPITQTLATAVFAGRKMNTVSDIFHSYPISDDAHSD